jgi:hypothetical protein
MRCSALCALAAVLAVATARPALAVSACTSFVEIGDDAGRSCVDIVRERARGAGFDGRRTEETVFFWFGSNVVTARCIGNSLIALSAYHQQADSACPLLDRVGGAVAHTKGSP